MRPVATFCQACGRRVHWLARVARRQVAAGLLAVSMLAAGAQLSSLAGHPAGFDTLGVGDQLAIGSNGSSRWAGPMAGIYLDAGSNRGAQTRTHGTV